MRMQECMSREEEPEALSAYIIVTQRAREAHAASVLIGRILPEMPEPKILSGY
jgi:hypothetical protein